MTDRIITTRQAAEEFYVPVRTIQTWTCRGLLTPVSPGLYRDMDVAKAEARTRRTARAMRLLKAAGETNG